MPTLEWLTRDEDLKAAARVPYKLLEADASLSAGDPAAGNMLIQGDNLEALKSLLPYYAGQVKCIYIDPSGLAEVTGTSEQTCTPSIDTGCPTTNWVPGILVLAPDPFGPLLSSSLCNGNCGPGSQTGGVRDPCASTASEIVVCASHGGRMGPVSGPLLQNVNYSDSLVNTAYPGPSFCSNPRYGAKYGLFSSGRIVSDRGPTNSFGGDVALIARLNGIETQNVIDARRAAFVKSSPIPVYLGHGWWGYHNYDTGFSNYYNGGINARINEHTGDVRLDIDSGSLLPGGHISKYLETCHY
jgi:hypothetical protein